MIQSNHKLVSLNVADVMQINVQFLLTPTSVGQIFKYVVLLTNFIKF